MSDRDTITLPREVVKLALEAFEAVMPFSTTQRKLKIRAVDALRAALAAEQPKQEPGLAELARQMKPLDADMAAILHDNLDSLYKVVHPLRDLPLGTLLYTAPPDAEALRRDAERLREELEEDAGVIAVWRGRTERAEAENERLREALEKVADASMSMHLNAAHMATSLQGIAKAAMRREET